MEPTPLSGDPLGRPPAWNERSGESPKPGPTIKRWTISELTAQIRGVVEPSFQQVWIQGEVSNYRPAVSGHAYFSLKDSGASISAAIFGWGARKKNFELKDGLQVACRGKISIYPPRGTYQIVIEAIEPLGAGALQAAFERLKSKLEAEGLFKGERKRPLPKFPQKIAVITSPSGAAIQDMLNILRRRSPNIHVVIAPALMQGVEASGQVIRALEYINQHSLADLVVIARGGGSIEDLWSFNDEGLARAIASSRLPVVSAIGHEIDFTISDFVADLRAPTPSAAAEILSADWVSTAQKIRELGARMRMVMSRDLAARRSVLTHISARVVSPKDRLREQAQRTDELSQRLLRAFEIRIQRRRAVLEQMMGKLDALSPLRVLERGYTLIRDPEHGSIILRSALQVKSGQRLEVTFYDGKKVVEAI